MPVFTRHHRFELALDQIEASGGDSEKAVAINLRWDGRVSEAREDEFDSIMGKPRDGSAFKTAIGAYYKKHVKREAIFDRESNTLNVAYGGGLGPSALRGGEDLCSVLDLNGLDPLIAKCKALGIARPLGLPPGPAGKSWARFLDNRLTDWRADTHGPLSAGSMQEKTLAATFGFLNKCNSVDPYHPTWSTTWKAFGDLLRNHPPIRWLEALGVDRGVPQFPRWLVVLKYQTRETVNLLRPTQLDRDWEKGGYHFPTPLALALREGGRTMDLGFNPRRRITLPEFIHRQLDWETRHAIAIVKVGVNPDYKQADIRTARLAHRAELQIAAAAPQSWMPDPI